MPSESKAPQEKFPLADIRKAGYGAIWRDPSRGTDPVETRRGLPSDPEDLHSRYIEAAVGGLTIGCFYLPNGNPAPGPKFDCKLALFERLQKSGKTLITSDMPFNSCARLGASPGADRGFGQVAVRQGPSSAVGPWPEFKGTGIRGGGGRLPARMGGARPERSRCSDVEGAVYPRQRPGCPRGEHHDARSSEFKID
jgi:hypothetical protein